MINLENFRRIIGAECAKEEKTKEKDIALLKKKMEHEIERATKGYEMEKAKREDAFNHCIKKVNEVYHRPMAADVLSSLEVDYNLMSVRSIILDITKKDLDWAIKYRGNLNRLKDEESRKILLETISDFNPSIKEAIESLSEDFNKTRAVTSFTAISSSGVYLLSPVINNPDKKLAINLEAKLFDVVSQGNVDMRDLRGLINRNSSGNGEVIEFTPDYQVVNGFLVYFLKPNISNGSVNLEKGIARKLCDENIQPEGFKQANLKHNIQTIPSEGINYFISHNPEEIICRETRIRKVATGSDFLSYEEAAKLAETEPRYIRKLATQGFFKKTESGIDESSFMSYLEKKHHS